MLVHRLFIDVINMDPLLWERYWAHTWVQWVLYFACAKKRGCRWAEARLFGSVVNLSGVEAIYNKSPASATSGAAMVTSFVSWCFAQFSCALVGMMLPTNIITQKRSHSLIIYMNVENPWGHSRVILPAESKISAICEGHWWCTLGVLTKGN